MAIDPRTLREVVREADCHLIPECLRVSNVTVRLDGDFDSQFGAACDRELQKYIEVFFGDRLTGQIALGGGSKSLKGIISASKGVFAIPKPKRGTIEDWASRALGLRDGKVEFQSFIGDIVDCARAELSIIHSAFLVLYQQDRKDVFGLAFDSVRTFFYKAIDGSLTNDDDTVLRQMVQIYVVFPPHKLKGDTIGMNDWRSLYDPSFDAGDGLLDEFPNKCVSEKKAGWAVTLPYSRSLRAKVKFER